MNLKEIREGLRKSRDPEKFLKDLLETTKDKKLKELIKQILEKKKSFGESRLERAVRIENVDLEIPEPRLTVQMPEVAEEDVVRTERADLGGGNKKEDVNYGLSSGVTYTTGSTHQQLEQSNLIARGGHLGNAETQGAIDKKMGEYHMSKDDNKYDSKSDGKDYDSSSISSSTDDDTFSGITGKKKKGIGDYV